MVQQQSNVPARSRQGELTKEQQELLAEIARQEDIPLTGLTLLGGKPYINVTGLDVKLRNMCEKEKLVLLSVEYAPFEVKVAQDGKYRAGGMGIVRLFDREGFQKALEALVKGKEPLTREILDSLKDLYVRTFKMNGWASSQTLQMSTMQNVDNIEMMAARRATNRAKREATGTGLTSIDEVDEVLSEEGQADEEAKERVAALLSKPEPKEVDAMFNTFKERFNVPKEVILRKLGISSATDVTKAHIAQMRNEFRAIDAGEKTTKEVFGELLENVVPRETSKPSPQTTATVERVDGVKLYNEIAAKIRTAKSTRSLDKVLEEVSDGYANDYLSREDAQELTQLASERREAILQGGVQ